MTKALIVIAVVIIIIIAFILKNEIKNLRGFFDTLLEPGNVRAGKQGETAATYAIKTVLREDDYLFTNIAITFDGKAAELDNIIVNKYGVFIIEVKNYKGRLYGEEDDYEWKKYKDDGYGNTFEKNVKNPIKQVKRQVYILAKYLEYYGCNVWVEGYAFLVQGNSPIRSASILTATKEINTAIHKSDRNRLTKKQVERIVRMIGR